MHRVPTAADTRDSLPIERRGSPLFLVVLCAAIAGWFALIRSFSEGAVYGVIGPFALGLSFVLIALRPKQVLHWLRPSWRKLGLGLAVGIAMTLLTYPAFWLATRVYPALEANVQALYVGAHATPLEAALGWTLVIMFAEELMFRGVFPYELAGRVSERSAFALSLLGYTLAQLGTGSFIVAAMALGCGGVWTWLRRYSQSLLSPLIAHMLWTPTVILFHPVTGT